MSLFGFISSSEDAVGICKHRISFFSFILKRKKKIYRLFTFDEQSLANSLTNTFGGESFQKNLFVEKKPLMFVNLRSSTNTTFSWAYDKDCATGWVELGSIACVSAHIYVYMGDYIECLKVG